MNNYWNFAFCNFQRYGFIKFIHPICLFCMSISKFIKKGRNAKQSIKCMFNLKIHTKKAKMKKRKHILLGFVCFYIPCTYFVFLFNLKIKTLTCTAHSIVSNFVA